LAISNVNTLEKKKIFTGKGDYGASGLIGKGRFLKSNRLFEALGSIEELSSFLGICKQSITEKSICQDIVTIQKALYRLMSDISYLDTNNENRLYLQTGDLETLERRIHDLSAGLVVPNHFIIPGDTPVSALVDYSRTLARKAERRVVQLFNKKEPKNTVILPYLNRLSSYLFVLELYLIQQLGGKQISINQNE